MLAMSGWVQRGRDLRTPSDPKGSSGKEVSLGAAGKPTRTFFGVSLLFFTFLWQNKFMSRWVKFFLAILLGLIIGLVYGWVISPVQYRDTTPVTLRYDYRTDYVLMVAEIFHSNQDVEQAIRQLAQLGSDSPEDLTIKSLAYAAQMGYSPEDMVLIQNLATAIQSWQPISGGSNP